MNKTLTQVLIKIFLFMSVCPIGAATYQNEYNVPVGINVPYYHEGSIIPEHIDIVLQPGDLYKGKIGKNGFIYEQYGLMPGLAEELVENNSTNVVVSWGLDRKNEDEEYKKFADGLTSTNMPDWWITQYQNSYFKLRARAEKEIKENYDKIISTNFYFDKEQYKKYYNQAIRLCSFLTNIQDRINDLGDPNSDPDKDGLDNRTEFYCGSNPWKESGVISYPKYLQIIPDGSQMVTSCFYIANHSKSNLFCKFDNALIYIQDKRYRPYLYDERGKAVDNGMDVPGQSTNKVFCLIKDEYFPRCFYGGYNIEISIANNLVGTIILYTPGDYSHPLLKPTNLLPKAGYCIEPGEKVLCSWRDEWNEDMQTYQTSNDYKLQVLGLRNKFPDILEITRKKSITLIDKDDWKYHRPEPGNYIWRVNKQTRFSNPISSDWSWFNIGREVAPQKARVYGSDQARVWGHNGAKVIIATVGEKYDLPIQMHSASNSCFLKPLLKNQEVYYNTNFKSFYVAGVFEKSGVYSNMWLNINKKGETNEHLYVFIVRNPSEDKNVRSFYYLKDKTIVHELFVNVPFEYKERQFFETFSKKDDLIWSGDLKMEFSETMPEGLSVSRTEDGEDLEIKGIPSTVGYFEIDLAFSNGKRHAKERHVFRIKDIGEPPFEFEKGLYVPKKKKKRTSSVYSEKKNIVNHYSYVGIDFEYPIYGECGKYKWMDDYWRFVRDFKIEVIGDPAPGLKLGDIPFCTNYVTKAETTALGFFGKPTQAGKFTNMVVLVEKYLVITNKHIFFIKQDLE